MSAARTPGGLRGVRRAAVVVIIVAVSVAAVLGIVLLLSGGWSDVQGRVLATAAAVAAFATTALCHLAQADRPLRVVGFTGIAASVLALVPILTIIWAEGDFVGSAGYDWFWKSFAVLGILAVSLAQANLLLLLASRRHRAVRIVLVAALATIAVVAVMIWLPILSDGDIPGDDGDWYWRLFGVVAILDALCTIVLPVLGILLKNPVAGLVTITVHAPTELVARLDAAAAAQGLTREATAVAALAKGLEPTDS